MINKHGLVSFANDAFLSRKLYLGVCKCEAREVQHFSNVAIKEQKGLYSFRKKR